MYEEKRTNADNLNTMAWINIVISIIGAISFWIKFSFININNKSILNWWGILEGIGILIAGFSLFFLFRTIYDIYYEVEK